MARPEVTGRKMMTSAGADAETPPIRGPPLAAFTIAEFVEAHRLSVSMYYKLKAQGLGPVEMVVGKRRYVSFEAAERWRRQREQVETATTAA